MQTALQNLARQASRRCQLTFVHCSICAVILSSRGNWRKFGSDTNFPAVRRPEPFGRAAGSANLGPYPKNPFGHDAKPAQVQLCRSAAGSTPCAACLPSRPVARLQSASRFPPATASAAAAETTAWPTAFQRFRVAGPSAPVPSAGGTLIYLDASPSLDAALARATAAGGRIVMARQALPPGMGFIAHITNLDGNRVGLHALT